MVTPSIGLPKASVTCTTSGSASAVPATPVCASPDTTARPLADAASATTVNSASTATGLSGRTTRTWPAASPTALPRVISALARPSPSVETVSGLATAPDSSMTTVAPATGRSATSRTSRMSGSARVSPTRPVSPSPCTMVTDAGSPSSGRTRSSPPQERATVAAVPIASNRRPRIGAQNSTLRRSGLGLSSHAQLSRCLASGLADYGLIVMVNVCAVLDAPPLSWATMSAVTTMGAGVSWARKVRVPDGSTCGVSRKAASLSVLTWKLTV